MLVILHGKYTAVHPDESVLIHRLYTTHLSRNFIIVILQNIFNTFNPIEQYFFNSSSITKND